MTTAEFWDLTPRETAAVLDAAVWRWKQEEQRMLSLAWHVAALTRARRMPSLDRLLRPPSKARDIPIEERRVEFEQMKRIVGETKRWQTKRR